MKNKIMVILTVAMMFTCNITVARGAEAKRVLFISSYSYTWPTVPEQMKGIQEELGENVNLDAEYMDTKILRDDTSTEKDFAKRIAHIYQHVKHYDAIIVGDDAAMQFAYRYKTSFLKKRLLSSLVLKIFLLLRKSSRIII